MIDSYTKTPRPIRDVEIEYSIDQSKCEICKDKPCLAACPIEAINIDPIDGQTKINSTCFGCVLCRNACPYDAITMETKLAPPIKENVPNINVKLCKACGACVQACKTGAIHINASGSGEAHSEIDPDACIRCGYCFRVCPTDAIKYGELIPKTVKGGKAIVINQDNCIGCMTCTRVCPSMGAINVSKTSKLPYINPSYCARCEECMHSCPSTAIKYSSRKRAFKTYSEIRSFDLVSSIVAKDMKKLSLNLISLNQALKRVATSLSMEFDDGPYEPFREFKVNDLMKEELGLILDGSITVAKFDKLFNNYLFNRDIEVIDNNCIACGECLNVCPVKAISLTPPNPIVIDDNCVYCGLCIETCKFEAIRLFDDYFYSCEDVGLYYARSYVFGQREGEFKLNHKKCQVCGICVNNCPTDALDIDDDEIEFDEEKCIYCRQCEDICPVDAIKLEIGKELDDVCENEDDAEDVVAIEGEEIEE